MSLIYIGWAIAIGAVIYRIYRYYSELKNYKEGTYYKSTNANFRTVKNDLGKYGEYLIYDHLKKYEETGSKFLFNVYVEKENDETTEIDVIMVSPKGLFVFESKNYSGWIFGSEWQKNWYQTLPQGKGNSHKESFYNPVMQNNSHIKHLKKILGDDIVMTSVIAFSDRCTLKNVNITSENISVVNRSYIPNIVAEKFNKLNDVLSLDEVDKIYNYLLPFSQVDEQIKKKHIEIIQNKLVDGENRHVEEKIKEQECSLKDSNKTDETVIEKTDKNNMQQVISCADAEDVEEVSTDTTDCSQKKCPVCGADLVLRTAKQGKNKGNQFYGCSNFPKCRYIENI